MIQKTANESDLTPQTLPFWLTQNLQSVALIVSNSSALRVYQSKQLKAPMGELLTKAGNNRVAPSKRLQLTTAKSCFLWRCVQSGSVWTPRCSANKWSAISDQTNEQKISGRVDLCLSTASIFFLIDDCVCVFFAGRKMKSSLPQFWGLKTCELREKWENETETWEINRSSVGRGRAWSLADLLAGWKGSSSGLEACGFGAHII